MKISKRECIYFIPIIVSFYILPLFITNIKLSIFLTAFIFLVCIMSIIFYAINLKSNIIYPILCILIYLPTNNIYNDKNWTYALIYIILIFLCYFIGKALSKFIYVDDMQRIS